MNCINQLEIDVYDDDFTDTKVYKTSIRFSYHVAKDSEVPKEITSEAILSNVKHFVNGLETAAIKSLLDMEY